MKHGLRLMFFTALLLFGTYGAFAYAVIGPEHMGQPERAGVKALLLLYVPLTSAVLAFGLPRLLDARGPAVRRFVAIICFGTVWLYGAYAIADACSVDFGNTWTTLEILLGFIILEWPAMLLMSGAALVYGLVLAHPDKT